MLTAAFTPDSILAALSGGAVARGGWLAMRALRTATGWPEDTVAYREGVPALHTTIRRLIDAGRVEARGGWSEPYAVRLTETQK